MAAMVAILDLSKIFKSMQLLNALSYSGAEPTIYGEWGMLGFTERRLPCACVSNPQTIRISLYVFI
jgi:hypothetical protein